VSQETVKLGNPDLGHKVNMTSIISQLMINQIPK